MVSILISSAIDLGLSPSLVKPKTVKLVLAASQLSTQSKNWLARNLDNVSEWSEVYLWAVISIASSI